MTRVRINFLAACSLEIDREHLRAVLEALDAEPDELDRMEEAARQREADAREVLLEGVFYEALERPEGDFDLERDERNAKRTLAALADALRAEIARQGLTPADLDLRLRWPEGRTERRLEDPSKLKELELDLLCQALGTSIDKLF